MADDKMVRLDKLGSFIGMYTCAEVSCTVWGNKEEVGKHVNHETPHHFNLNMFNPLSRSDYALAKECIGKKYELYSKQYIEKIGEKNIVSVILSTFIGKLREKGITHDRDHIFALLYYFSNMHFKKYDNKLYAFKIINEFSKEHGLKEKQTIEIFQDILVKSRLETVKEHVYLKEIIHELIGSTLPSSLKMDAHY